MIIDSHQHVFWHGRDDRGLIADMDQHHIDVAWLLSWDIIPQEDNRSYHGVLNPTHFRADGTHAGSPLSDSVLARDRFPKRFIVGYCPHPGNPSAPAMFEAAYHIHRVRVCGEWKFRMCFDDPRCIELYRKAGELKCPIVLHLDVPYLINPETKRREYQPLWYGGTIDNLERALRACPGTIFIGHAPGFWREISDDADSHPSNYPNGPLVGQGRLQRLLDTHENLYADLSAGSALRALKRDVSHAREFLCRYADRMLFGRDYYGGELLEFLATLDLPRDVREKIFCTNAQRLVSLSNDGGPTSPLITLGST